MKYHARLKRLELRLQRGCQVCAPYFKWPGMRTVRAEDLENEPPSPPVPDRCSHCRRKLPKILEILIVIPAGFNDSLPPAGDAGTLDECEDGPQHRS